MRWVTVPLDKALNLNVEERALRSGLAALENAFHSDSGGVTRFPGLEEFIGPEKLPGGASSRIYLSDWQEDLIATTDTGLTFRVDEAGNAENVSKVAISGGLRPIFAKTEQQLLIAAGGPIVQFAGDKTEILSREAPESTHICFLAGRVIAIEPGSGRFQHTAVGDYSSWDPLDTFAAEGTPDNLTCAIVSPFGALVLGGKESVEQYDISSSGTRPFFRRGDIGIGVFQPYTLVSADQSLWCLDPRRFFSSIAGPASRSVSDDIQLFLDRIDDWTDAWAAEMIANGQAFILLQAPRATNRYETEGVTLAYDYRKKRWSELYGFDTELGLPAVWPGTSVHKLWGQTFVGMRGRICRLSRTGFWNPGSGARLGVRTAHFSTGRAGIDVNNVRLEAVRGVGAVTATRDPIIRLRGNKDGRGWSRWVERSMGATGAKNQVLQFGRFGACDTIQFEIQVWDDCPVDIASCEIQVKDLRR